MHIADSVSYASHLASSEVNPNHISHIYEFAELSKRIAIEQIYEIVPSLVEDICRKTIKEYLEGNLSNSLNYDIHSIASISIKDLNAMFQSSAFSKFVSDAVAEEIRNRIGEIDLNLKL